VARIVIDHSRANPLADTISTLGNAAGAFGQFLISEQQRGIQNDQRDRSLDLTERRIGQDDRSLDLRERQLGDLSMYRQQQIEMEQRASQRADRALDLRSQMAEFDLSSAQGQNAATLSAQRALAAKMTEKAPALADLFAPLRDSDQPLDNQTFGAMARYVDDHVSTQATQRMFMAEAQAILAARQQPMEGDPAGGQMQGPPDPSQQGGGEMGGGDSDPMTQIVDEYATMMEAASSSQEAASIYNEFSRQIASAQRQERHAEMRVNNAAQIREMLNGLAGVADPTGVIASETVPAIERMLAAYTTGVTDDPDTEQSIYLRTMEGALGQLQNSIVNRRQFQEQVLDASRGNLDFGPGEDQYDIEAGRDRLMRAGAPEGATPATGIRNKDVDRIQRRIERMRRQGKSDEEIERTIAEDYGLGEGEVGGREVDI